MENRNIDLAYLAGIFDGEGCVGIYRTNISRKSSIGWWLKVVISNSDLPLILWIKENFGGSIGKIHENRPGCKQCYTWQTSGAKAAAMLQELFPYLKVKKERARLAISFHGDYALRRYRKTPEDYSLFQRYKDRFTALNAKGVPPEIPGQTETPRLSGSKGGDPTELQRSVSLEGAANQDRQPAPTL